MFVQECLMAERMRGRRTEGAIDSPPSLSLLHLHNSGISRLGTALHKRVGRPRPAGGDYFRRGDKIPLLLNDLGLLTPLLTR